MPKLLAFRTPHERGVLVFGVPSAKYLTFGTPDGDGKLGGDRIAWRGIGEVGVANFIHIHEPTHYPPYLGKS